MENKPAQNIQDTFLNTVRKDKTPITIYLVSGVKLTGKIRSFDKYSVLLENNSQEQLIFKHAISTVVSNRSVMHTEHRPVAMQSGTGPTPMAVRVSGRPRSSDNPRESVSIGVQKQQERGLWNAPGALGRILAAAGTSCVAQSGRRSRAGGWTPASPSLCAGRCPRLQLPRARRWNSQPVSGYRSRPSLSEPESELGASQLPCVTASTAEESSPNFASWFRAPARVAAELMQRRARPDPATLIGAGKVEEIAGVAASTEADLVLFDHDLTATQLRNLEAALPCRVLDRTQLILDIFARHARTREGQLQVELAQLEYMLPRLTGKGKAMSQLGGGIGTRGPGETKLETDRRQIQRRIDHLKEELDPVRRVRRQQRQRREAVPVPTVALVGYTNAGKSTLFNRLTGAHVLASSRMFATLDPKLRAIELPSRRKVLLPTRWDSSATCPTRWSPASAPRLKRLRRPRFFCTCATPRRPMATSRSPGGKGSGRA